MELRGKTALVTGSAKRLGREIALALAGEGVSIAAHWRSARSGVDDLCDEVRRLGVEAWSIQGELSHPEEAETLMARAIEAAGPVHILVNSAAAFGASTMESVTFDDVCTHTAINAWAPFALSRALAAQELEGSIVNLLDTRVQGDDWKHVGYILSKHALAVLTRMCALHFAPRVAVNAVAPGLILPPPGEDESYLQRLAETVPLKRHGGPDDIAQAVLFLLKSRFVTGQVIFVDGGAHLWTPS